MQDHRLTNDGPPEDMLPAESGTRTQASRCPRCGGLEATTTGTATTQESNTVQVARVCPCGHCWVETHQR